jgi:hypothetical protein
VFHMIAHMQLSLVSRWAVIVLSLVSSWADRALGWSSLASSWTDRVFMADEDWDLEMELLCWPATGEIHILATRISRACADTPPHVVNLPDCRTMRGTCIVGWPGNNGGNCCHRHMTLNLLGLKMASTKRCSGIQFCWTMKHLRASLESQRCSKN